MNASSAVADKPLISVIIPVYNAEKYLERCVKSVLGQTYSNLEILLVDDGSPDNCGRMCDEFAAIDSRIRVIHKENGGVASARNAALDAMTGKYVTFVDSDDYVTDDYVEYLYRLIKNNPIEISCGMFSYDRKNIVSYAGYVKKECSLDYISAMEVCLYNNEGVTECCKLFLSRLFNNIRFPDGRIFEDLDVFYRVSEGSRGIAFGEKAIYFYRVNQDSITGKAFRKQLLDHVEITEELCSYLKKYPDLERACNRRIMYACVNVLRREVLSANRDKKLEKQLAARVKSVRWDVLTNPQCSKRDKAAVLSLMLGPGFFRFAWKVYAKLTHRT